MYNLMMQCNQVGVILRYLAAHCIKHQPKKILFYAQDVFTYECVYFFTLCGLKDFSGQMEIFEIFGKGVVSYSI